MSSPRVEELQRYAWALIEGGQLQEGLDRLQEVIRLEPGNADHWCSLARVLARHHYSQEAIQCLQRGAELDPAHQGCRSGLGHLHQERSEVEEALHWHGQALALQPDSLFLQLNHLFVFPVIARSQAQIDHCRERAWQGVQQLLAQGALRLVPEHEVTSHTFRLAYHGRNDRDLLIAYARLWERGLADCLPPPAPVTLHRGKQGARHRIGILSAFLHSDHSNTRAFEGLIRGLDPGRFELVLIQPEPGDATGVDPQLRSCFAQILHLSQALPEAWHLIQALELDLLFYPDIGMHPFLPWLASQRLAPVQASGWGIPHTSGYNEIDFYLSCDALEPDSAQDHYSETLIRLPGLPCRYLSSALPSPEATHQLGRDYFLLPDAGTRLCGCLQHWQKLHPDFDPILEAIAREVPDVGFVLIEPKEAGLAEAFLARISHSAPAFRERLIVLSPMSRPEFIALAGNLDLLLDPLHYGSGVTVFETLITGTPTVCLDGSFMRSRLIAAAYRRMGLHEAPIARDSEDYIRLAVTLLREDGRRQALRQRIRHLAPSALLNDAEVVRGFETFAEEAIQRSRAALR